MFAPMSLHQATNFEGCQTLSRPGALIPALNRQGAFVEDTSLAYRDFCGTGEQSEGLLESRGLRPDQGSRGHHDDVRHRPMLGSWKLSSFEMPEQFANQLNYNLEIFLRSWIFKS
jgi:hypothetical protein